MNNIAPELRSDKDCMIYFMILAISIAHEAKRRTFFDANDISKINVYIYSNIYIWITIYMLHKWIYVSKTADAPSKSNASPPLPYCPVTAFFQ